MFLGQESEKTTVSRYWDSSRERFCVKILPGEYYFSCEKELISTILGSCVSACIWDEANKIGGMNHFMLPKTSKEGDEVTWGNLPTEAARYGNYAMEYLINELIKHGGNKDNFKVKLFGGAKVLSGIGDVGKRNVDFVHQYVAAESLNVISEDLGADYTRRLLFEPLTGRVWMKKLSSKLDSDSAKKEIEYSKKINVNSISGDVDLF